jgi:serine/threonine protein kinase
MPTLLALDRLLTRHSSVTFGRYELLGRLGVGGMAEVFVARCGDFAEMRSLLAVKRILPHLADDEGFVALFRREAQISLRLRHRAIARVFEVGRVDTAWFLAMELVPGESLAHLRRAESELKIAVDPRLVAWVGAEIACALHHAHALTDGLVPLEVIHRDVSPQNLLLGFDGVPKLIDFGVARCARLSDTTRTGTVRGKLAYASPEQLGARPLDGRSDLFSLAIVLYEWLVRAPLFARDSDAATVQAVQTAPIPPVMCAPALGAVLARALERAPERRFPDGESFAQALLDAVGGRPPAPERLLEVHLAKIFPEHKQRWQTIVAGRDIDVTGFNRSRETAGGTVPSSRSVMDGGAFPRRRVRRRLILAFTAAAAVGSLLAGWARWDRPVAHHVLAPTFAPARDPVSLARGTPVTPVPASAEESHLWLTRRVASDPGSQTSARDTRETRKPRERDASEKIGRRRLRGTPKSVAANPGARMPASTLTSTPASRRAIVDELEPSPYAPTL